MSGSLPAMLRLIPLLAAVVRPIWIICFSSCAPLLSFAACPGGTETKVPSARITANAVKLDNSFANRCATIIDSLSFEGVIDCLPCNGRGRPQAVSLRLDFLSGRNGLAIGPLTEVFHHADFVPVDIVLAVQCVTAVGRDRETSGELRRRFGESGQYAHL